MAFFICSPSRAIGLKCKRLVTKDVIANNPKIELVYFTESKHVMKTPWTDEVLRFSGSFH